MKKILSREEIDKALMRIEVLAPDAVLVGGLALRLYGSPRFTSDVDVLVLDVPADLGETRPLSFGGVRTRLEGVPVDFIVRADDVAPLYQAAFNTAVVVPGVRLHVAQPEYLAVMKLNAARPKDEDDLVWLLPSVDQAKAEALAKKYLGSFGGKMMRAAVLEAEWRKTRVGPEDAEDDE